MENYYISLFDKETRKLSERVPLKNVIYDRNEIEFVFPSDELDYETLPYNDFLFFRQNYEVIIENDKENIKE